jgi:transcriptional regulator with XRE-family HTH domain
LTILHGRVKWYEKDYLMSSETKENRLRRYLHLKFLEWQMEAGYKRTQTEFAKHLGVAPGTLGHWMNGVRTPDLDSVELLSKKLGPEIYDLAGYLRPDPQLRKVVSRWHKVNEAGKISIMNIVMEAVNQESTEQHGSSVEVSD